MKKTGSGGTIHMTTTALAPPLDALERFGDPGDSGAWIDGEPNYVTQLGLTAAHIPALIEVARRWANEDQLPAGDACWASVHAWRALAQLQATQAIDPLLGMLSDCADLGDDWVFEDFPTVFAMLGPAAIAPLGAFFENTEHTEHARIAVASSLCEIALLHPQSRADIVRVLTNQLTGSDAESAGLNGFIVNYLIKLDAKESAEAIERAFAVERVESWICGSWGRVRRDLGVDGLGLAVDGQDQRPDAVFNVDQPHPSVRGIKAAKKSKSKQAESSPKRNRRS
jgi:hypothetical protein